MHYLSQQLLDMDAGREGESNHCTQSQQTCLFTSPGMSKFPTTPLFLLPTNATDIIPLTTRRSMMVLCIQSLLFSCQQNSLYPVSVFPKSFQCLLLKLQLPPQVEVLGLQNYVPFFHCYNIYIYFFAFFLETRVQAPAARSISVNGILLETVTLLPSLKSQADIPKALQLYSN